MLDFNVLEPTKVTLDIETEYGRKISIPLVVPSYMEWYEAEASVIGHQPPKRKGANGSEVPDYTDPTFIRDSNLDTLTRRSRIVAIAMEKAGWPIEGSTLEAKGQFVESKLEVGVLRAIYTFLESRLNLNTKQGALEDRAAGFPPDEDGDDAGALADGADGGGLALVE